MSLTMRELAGLGATPDCSQFQYGVDSFRDLVTWCSGSGPWRGGGPAPTHDQCSSNLADYRRKLASYEASLRDCMSAPSGGAPKAVPTSLPPKSTTDDLRSIVQSLSVPPAPAFQRSQYGTQQAGGLMAVVQQALPWVMGAAGIAAVVAVGKAALGASRKSNPRRRNPGMEETYSNPGGRRRRRRRR